MSTAVIDLGPLPAGAKSVLLEYRRQDHRAWHRLGETTASISEWQITGGSVQVAAIIRDKNGKLHRPGTITTWDTEEAISPALLPKDISTFPAPVVTQDGPVLTITADVAPGLDPDDYEMEIRQGEDGGAAKDGLQIGFARPGEPVDAHAWPTATGIQTLHARPHRIEDGRLGDFAAVDFDVPLPILAPTSGHSNDFAAGTLVPTDAGVVPLEISGGDLRHKAIYAGDLTGTIYAGDVTDVYAGDAGLYWSPAKYTTATVAVSPAEDLVFQVYPDLTSTSRLGTLYAGDCHWPAALPHFQEDGAFHDPRVFEASLQNGADETPFVMTSEVNVNGAGNVDLVPGQPAAAVTSWAMTHTFKTFLGKRITINNIHCRHWIWCRGRPWHSHSGAFELIHENTISGSAAATYDVSAVNGDDFDELVLQVLWKNNNAGATNLWLRPNNDAGTNYDLDGGADSKIIVGGNTVAQNEWEDVRVRFHNPIGSAERAITIESNARWTATTSDSSDSQDTYVWTDNAAEISTIRVLTAGGATTHLAVGTITRLWGKRHHTE